MTAPQKLSRYFFNIIIIIIISVVDVIYCFFIPGSIIVIIM